MSRGFRAGTFAVLRQQHRFFLTVLVAVDAILIVSAVALAFLLRYSTLAGRLAIDESTPAFSSHAVPLLAALPSVLGAMVWAGLYKPRRDQVFLREALDIFKAVIVGVLLTLAVHTLFNKTSAFSGRDPSRAQYLITGVLLLLMLTSWRYAFRLGLRSIRRRGWNVRYVAVIGSGRLAHDIVRTLQRNSWTGFRPVFCICHKTRAPRESCGGVPVLGTMDDLERVLDEHKVSGVFLALPGRMVGHLPDLLMRLDRYPVDVRVVPDMPPKYMSMNMAVNDLDGVPVLSIRESPLAGWGGVAKRTVDLLGSLVMILVLLVPMLMIAALVRSSGRGPILFRQERMSLNGRRFRIFKFRTMIDQPGVLDDESMPTQKGDQRITTVGRFLRSTSLDELPQLFNVVLGEMSLVGPRPLAVDEIDTAREDWKGFMLRQNVRAGMTGWAQINGLRGSTSLRKRLQYDLFYIRNWSIGFDMWILWKTIFQGFAHPNAH